MGDVVEKLGNILRAKQESIESIDQSTELIKEIGKSVEQIFNILDAGK